jgi:hypothetical protein
MISKNGYSTLSSLKMTGLIPSAEQAIVVPFSSR